LISKLLFQLGILQLQNFQLFCRNIDYGWFGALNALTIVIELYIEELVSSFPFVILKGRAQILAILFHPVLSARWIKPHLYIFDYLSSPNRIAHHFFDHITFAVKNFDSFILGAELEKSLVALRRVSIGVLHVIKV